MSDMDAINAAVEAAQEAYEQADKSPFDHGFAHLNGIDGRTKFASLLKQHDEIKCDSWDYVTISGLSRYCSPQQKGYRAFLSTLEDRGVDTDGIYVSSRLD